MPMLKTGRFYKREWGYPIGQYTELVYIHSVEKQGPNNHSYFGTFKNTVHADQTKADCGRYFWEYSSTGSIRKEKWTPLKEKESRLAASEMFDTDIRKQFDLPIHPDKVRFHMWLMNNQRAYREQTKTGEYSANA